MRPWPAVARWCWTPPSHAAPTGRRRRWQQPTGPRPCSSSVSARGRSRCSGWRGAGMLGRGSLTRPAARLDRLGWPPGALRCPVCGVGGLRPFGGAVPGARGPLYRPAAGHQRRVCAPHPACALGRPYTTLVALPTRCATRWPYPAEKWKALVMILASPVCFWYALVYGFFRFSARRPAWKKPGSDAVMRSPRIRPIRKEGVG